ncbi:hypothetical protein KGF57_001498 [Candida theae]|uniref:Uncharacterized protein n=1 Tax=Candida theae TaxID=1198502 RepID=A0AAD5BGX1_9ASCO|nr:uncharacterized protein KGF57_001498 [Candida theae]KAI5962053.1 hypothetical protein KGF57_001498 [Candida theae]
MSNRVFDDSENKTSIKPFNKDSQNENTHVSNKGSNFRATSKFKRVPLGGKNQNTNTFELNRSKSTVNSLDSFRSNNKPPSLVKSNSSLGFQSVPVYQEHDQSAQLHGAGTKVREKEVNLSPINVTRSDRRMRKRHSLDELSRPKLLSPKKTKLFQTDSLVKSEVASKHELISNIEGTLSDRTETLNARHIANQDITRNNVDPIKQTVRSHSIDALVGQHWQDEIEFIPQAQSKKDTDSLMSFNDYELQYFSTPNDSHELKHSVHNDGELNLDLDFDDGTGDDAELEANMTIDRNGDEDYGLNDEDLRNLLS